MKNLLLIAFVISVLLVLAVGSAFTAPTAGEKYETWERGGYAATSEIGGATGASSSYFVEDGAVILKASAGVEQILED